MGSSRLNRESRATRFCQDRKSLRRNTSLDLCWLEVEYQSTKFFNPYKLSRILKQLSDVHRDELFSSERGDEVPRDRPLRSRIVFVTRCN